MLTVEKFLEEQGIELKATSLICYIDGAMRQPNLIALMDGYHQAKTTEEKELDLQKKKWDYLDTKSLSTIMSGGEQDENGQVRDQVDSPDLNDTNSQG